VATSGGDPRSKITKLAGGSSYQEFGTASSPDAGVKKSDQDARRAVPPADARQCFPLGTVDIAGVCGVLPGRPRRDRPAPRHRSGRSPRRHFASEQFHAITGAEPKRLWNALIATGFPLDLRHGMTVDIDWQPGARVTMPLTDQWRSPARSWQPSGPPAGLHGQRSTRLTICDVTWELRRAGDGTMIRLNVDEPWPLAGTSPAGLPR